MLTLCIADAERDVGMKNLSRKEAITILESMRVDIPVPKAAVTQIKRNLALDMAINALNCSEIPNKSDTISRQAAIDAMGKAKWAKERLEQLPPAQPEHKRGSWENDKDDLPRCSECGYIPEYNRHIDDYYYSDFCPNCGAKMEVEHE